MTKLSDHSAAGFSLERKEWRVRN